MRRHPLRDGGWVVRALVLHFLMGTAVHTIRPMVSYRALELGASAVDLGIIAASFALLSFALAVPMGRWVDRLGEPRFLLGGTFTIVVIALWMTAIGGLVTLAVAQALLGVGQLASAVGLQTLLANAGAPQGRDARIGAMSVAISFAQMVGPAGAGFLAGVTTTLMPVFVAAAGVGLGAALLALSLLLRPPRVHERRGGAALPVDGMGRTAVKVVRIPGVPNALLASLTATASVDILIVYLPAYGEARGIPVATVGLLLGVRGAASIVSRLTMLPLLRWLGRRRLLTASILVSCLAILAVPLTASTPLLLTLMIVAGFGLGLGQPLALVWIANRVPVEMRGTAIGMRITGNRSAQVLVPMLVGAIAGVTGIGAVFVALGAMLGTSGVVVWRGRFGGEPSRSGDGASTDRRRGEE